MPNDTERVLALLSLEQQQALENFEAIGVHNSSNPTLLFDGLDSMLQPRRLYIQTQMQFEAPMFAPTVRRIAQTQVNRRAQRPDGILFSPILLNSIANHDTCPEDFLIGLDKHGKHRMVSGEAKTGTYYTNEAQSPNWMLRFGETDGLSWIGVNDMLDPNDARAHWIGTELHLFAIELPEILLASIEAMKGEPITRVIEHPALAGILIDKVESTPNTKGSGLNIIIKPDMASYLAMHRRVPVVDIHD